MAKKTTIKSIDNFHVIFAENSGERKAVSKEDFSLFNEFSPESGNFVIESSYATKEEADAALVIESTEE